MGRLRLKFEMRDQRPARLVAGSAAPRHAGTLSRYSCLHRRLGVQRLERKRLSPRPIRRFACRRSSSIWLRAARLPQGQWPPHWPLARPRGPHRRRQAYRFQAQPRFHGLHQHAAHQRYSVQHQRTDERTPLQASISVAESCHRKGLGLGTRTHRRSWGIRGIVLPDSLKLQ